MFTGSNLTPETVDVLYGIVNLCRHWDEAFVMPVNMLGFYGNMPLIRSFELVLVNLDPPLFS